MSDPLSIALETGQVLDIPPAFWAAFDQAMTASCGIEDPAAARTAFGEALAKAIYQHDLVLAPAGRRQSSQTVSIDTYTLALNAKHDAERRLHFATIAFGPTAERGELHAEFHAAVLALTGHAPPGVARIAGVDERLRVLRALLLGVAVDEPPAELPAPDVIAR